MRSIVAPGQTKIASVSFQILHGIAATVIERETLASIVSEAEAATMINVRTSSSRPRCRAFRRCSFCRLEVALIQLRLMRLTDALQRIREALKRAGSFRFPSGPLRSATGR